VDDLLLNYGVLGICVVALSGFIMFLYKQHKDERKEWRGTIEKSTDAINNNTNMVTALKVMLETINRRSG